MLIRPLPPNAYAKRELSVELLQVEKSRPDGTVVDRENWGLDATGNWLSRTIGSAGMIETRVHNTVNQLEQIGGAGSTAVEGRVNEFASVKVNGEFAEIHREAVGGGWRFRKTIPVQEGVNTVEVVAMDPQNEVSTQRFAFTVP